MKAAALCFALLIPLFLVGCGGGGPMPPTPTTTTTLAPAPPAPTPTTTPTLTPAVTPKHLDLSVQFRAGGCDGNDVLPNTPDISLGECVNLDSLPSSIPPLVGIIDPHSMAIQQTEITPGIRDWGIGVGFWESTNCQGVGETMFFYGHCSHGESTQCATPTHSNETTSTGVVTAVSCSPARPAPPPPPPAPETTHLVLSVQFRAGGCDGNDVLPNAPNISLGECVNLDSLPSSIPRPVGGNRDEAHSMAIEQTEFTRHITTGIHWGIRHSFWNSTNCQGERESNSFYGYCDRGESTQCLAHHNNETQSTGVVTVVSCSADVLGSVNSEMSI